VQQLPQPVDVFMLYPNYRGMLFDDQPQTMRFDVTVTPPGGDFGRVKIRGALKDEGTGQQLSSQDFTASANFVAQIDGSGMQAGRAYQVVFSVVDAATGGVTYTYPAYRVSKVAGSARASMNISVDAKNRLLVRGTPRFVLGVYDSGMGYGSDDVFWENLLWSDSGERHMNGLRINFYLNYWYGAAPAPQMDSLMANLQKHGVMYLQTGNCFDKFPADNAFLINSSDATSRYRRAAWQRRLLHDRRVPGGSPERRLRAVRPVASSRSRQHDVRRAAASARCRPVA